MRRTLRRGVLGSGVIVHAAMSPELMNLAISLGVFALLALIWRKLFATPAFPGSAVAPAMAARGDAAKPRNVVEIRGATQFDELINSGPACFVDWTASWYVLRGTPSDNELRVTCHL